MSVLAQFISNAVERLLFHPLTVTSVEPVGKHFRLMRVMGNGFKGFKWSEGQKVQIMVGPLTKRAYTPMDLDPVKGSASFLLYLHGSGPGAAWAAAARVGDVCNAMRPQDSIDFASFSAPALFFGDETSLAAAQTLSQCERLTARSQFLFEVSSIAQTARILRRLNIPNTELIQKNHDGSHLPLVVSKLIEQATLMLSPQWILTGQAQSIQGIRRGLNQAGVPLLRSKVKAYWSLGKSGLD